MRRRIFTAILILGALLTLSGCSGKKEIEIEGIIILEVETTGYGESYEFTVKSMNPKTGGQKTISHFRIDAVDRRKEISFRVYPGLCRYASYKDMLSEDFTKLACAKIYPGGSVHAGWLDENGDFFDVTESLGLHSKKEDEDLTKYFPVGFAEDGSFVYCDDSQVAQYYHVPVDNVTQTEIKKGSPYRMDILKDSEYSVRFGSRITSWIDDEHYLCDVETLDRNKEVSLDSRIVNITDTRYSVIPYIPDNSGKNWSGVADSDGQNIAYFSYRPDEGYGLFVRNLSGEESDKVEVDMSLGHGEIKNQIENIEGICITLIGWR